MTLFEPNRFIPLHFLAAPIIGSEAKLNKIGDRLYPCFTLASGITEKES